MDDYYRYSKAVVGLSGSLHLVGVGRRVTAIGERVATLSL
jgi:hypothetical protein